MLSYRKKRITICKEKINGLIQTVINSKKILNTKEMKMYLERSYPKKVIEECTNLYGLEMPASVQFIMWPVFMGTIADSINICAVNFGALTLYEKDITNGYNQQIKEYINAAVNVLVVTNLKKETDGMAFRYWPTSIDYTNKTEWGTINQASLSLTSLYKFGFLDKKSLLTDEKLDEVTRVNRFRFFVENLNWILSIQNNVGNNCAAWTYAENCKDIENGNRITTALVPSQFCYELVSRLYTYFMSCDENKKIINEIDPTLLQRMEVSCQTYENWIANMQKEDGGYSRNNNSSKSSFAHSCCAMLTYVYNDSLENKKKDATRFNRLINYLIKHHKNFNFEIEDVSDNYKFQYEANKRKGYVNDVYEIFPETLFLINCCKNIDDENGLIKWYHKRALRCVNYKSYERLFSRLETVQINNTSNNLAVKGRQKLAQKYPIYALYYTKICLQRLKNNDELPMKERRKYISLPLSVNLKALILFLLLATCVLVAYLINPSDTIITLILSIATFLFPTILHLCFKKNNKN